MEPIFEVLFYIGLDILIYDSKGRRELLSPQINEKSHRVCLSLDAEEQITPHTIF